MFIIHHANFLCQKHFYGFFNLKKQISQINSFSNFTTQLLLKNTSFQHSCTNISIFSNFSIYHKTQFLLCYKNPFIYLVHNLCSTKRVIDFENKKKIWIFVSLKICMVFISIQFYLTKLGQIMRCRLYVVKSCQFGFIYGTFKMNCVDFSRFSILWKNWQNFTIQLLRIVKKIGKNEESFWVYNFKYYKYQK